MADDSCRVDFKDSIALDSGKRQKLECMLKNIILLFC